MRKKWVLYTLLAFALVAFCTAGANATTWTVNAAGGANYKTITAAVSNTKTKAGDTIKIFPGKYSGVKVSKKLIFQGTGATNVIVNGSPNVPYTPGKAGFYFVSGSDGSQVRNIGFAYCDFPVYAYRVSTVTVLKCIMKNPVQGVTNWGGSGWTITENQILGLQTKVMSGDTMGAGGIGILIADQDFLTVKNNKVTKNNISGKLTKASADKGGHEGSGITLYADWRGDRDGTKSMTANTIGGTAATKNTILLTSSSSKVPVHAIGVNEAKEPPLVGANHKIKGNTVKSNVMNMTKKVVMYPEDLADYNTIQSRLDAEFDVLDSQLPPDEDAPAGSLPVVPF